MEFIGFNLVQYLMPTCELENCLIYGPFYDCGNTVLSTRHLYANVTAMTSLDTQHCVLSTIHNLYSYRCIYWNLRKSAG